MSKINELCGLLKSKRPDDRVEYETQNNGVHFAFTDARRRRFVLVIDHDLLEARSSKEVIDRLDVLNWQLVTGALQGKHTPIFTEQGVE